ncbi:hypothetical protein KAU11_12450 [Candidatus Babeliales bacterium]|nr:hypothetical protein [Candidatus Babeliales bacterium]
MAEVEYKTKEGLIASIKAVAPSLGIRKLEKLVDQHPYNQVSDFIADKIFNNGLTSIPSDFLDIQKSYLNLGMYYYQKYVDEQDVNHPSLNLVSELTATFNELLNEKELPKRLGASKVYKEIAEDVLTFYNENKDNIELLREVGTTLDRIYICLGRPSRIWDRMERKGNDISILRNIAKKEGDSILKDPNIVKQIWEEVKKKYQNVQ